MRDERYEEKKAYSFFTNEYVLTKELCAEAERSRMDVGILYVLSVATFALCVCLMDYSGTWKVISDMLREYFSAPSPGTILELSGAGIMAVAMPVGFFAAGVAFVKSFPKLVGEKRLKEQLSLVPSVNRRVDFYDEYVEIQGKFSRKLPYYELKRVGETRNLYLLFFTGKRMLILHKAGFRKGNLADLKIFVKERRTRKSKIYGIIRYVPVVCVIVLFLGVLWMEMG